MEKIVWGKSTGKDLERDMYLAYLPKTKCELCEQSGLIFISNGTDDFDVEYCACPVGSTKKVREWIDLVANTKKV